MAFTWEVPRGREKLLIYNGTLSGLTKRHLSELLGGNYGQLNWHKDNIHLKGRHVLRNKYQNSVIWTGEIVCE